MTDTIAAPRRAARRATISSRAAHTILAAMMVVGLGLRLVHITDLPVDFQPARQYHSALIARNFDLGNGGSHPTMEQRVAAVARDPLIEPPIIELVTAGIWHLSGQEDLWVPRAIMSLVWIIGAALLYALARRLAGRVAGLAAAAVFIFDPVAIISSRVFQPDPLMVTAIVGAVLAVVVDDDRCTTRSLVVAGLAAGFALFTKEVAVFFVAPVFLVLAWRRSGPGLLRQGRTWAFAALATVPVVAYSVFGYWVDPFLGSESGGRILPHLLTTGFFWSGWWSLATITVPAGVLLVALAGLIGSRGRAQATMGALVAGYVGFGLLFTYHYATHSYYHLPLIFVAALGVGLAFGILDRWWCSGQELTLGRMALGAAAVALVAAGVVVNSVSLVPEPISPGVTAEVLQGNRAVGRLVHHDTKLIMLAPVDGTLLRYYGYVAGTTWPQGVDVRAERLQGVPIPPVAAQLSQLSRAMGGAHYFVVTDFVEWPRQPATRAYLDAHYPVIASAPLYRIYDLRHPLSGS